MDQKKKHCPRFVFQPWKGQVREMSCLRWLQSAHGVAYSIVACGNEGTSTWLIPLTQTKTNLPFQFCHQNSSTLLNLGDWKQSKWRNTPPPSPRNETSPAAPHNGSAWAALPPTRPRLPSPGASATEPTRCRRRGGFVGGRVEAPLFPCPCLKGHSSFRFQ